MVLGIKTSLQLSILEELLQNNYNRKRTRGLWINEWITFEVWTDTTTYMYLITIRKTVRIYVSKFIGIIILKHQLISHTYKETNTVVVQNKWYTVCRCTGTVYLTNNISSDAQSAATPERGHLEQMLMRTVCLLYYKKIITSFSFIHQYYSVAMKSPRSLSFSAYKHFQRYSYNAILITKLLLCNIM